MKVPKKNKFVFNPAHEFAPPVSLEIARACAEIMLNKRIAKPTKKQWVRFTKMRKPTADEWQVRKPTADEWLKWAADAGIADEK